MDRQVYTYMKFVAKIIYELVIESVNDRSEKMTTYLIDLFAQTLFRAFNLAGVKVVI